jgi:uncharacterized cupin superfamily protein
MDTEKSLNAPGFRKVNVREIAERRYAKEGRLGYGKPISEALGRKPESTDLAERHPFDVEILRVPPKAVPWRYRSHSAQCEFYYVLAGTGTIRHAGGQTPIVAGDAFLSKPGEPHQIINSGDDDLEIVVIADNPIGESYHYPDEAMWIVNSPERRYVVLHPERERSVPAPGRTT